MAYTQVADVIVPEIFGPYVQQLTTEKSELVQSGALVLDDSLSNLLAGGGLTFHQPSWKDLDNDDEDIVTDEAPGVNDATPAKIGTAQEIQVRLSRSKTWGTTDLTGALAGSDPAQAIANRVAYYRTRKLQKAFIATVKGIFADNAAAPSGSDTHTQNDMIVDISGASFVDGTTNFSTEAFIDAQTTMGDSADMLGLVMVHPVVKARMKKNNLIDFIPDSEGRVNIPTFLGLRVIEDAAMPVTSGVYTTWLFGAGVFRLGQGSPKVPVETFRYPLAGKGGGAETLTNRWEWIIHSIGHAYIGTAPSGGPSNASSSNNLAAAGSWSRRWPERNQVKMAQLITRETA